MRKKIRTYFDVADPARENIVAQVLAQHDQLAERLKSVRNVVLIASGKGGVGKSALTANLAVALARAGARTGALDADLNGPSLARMFGHDGAPLEIGEGGVTPVRGPGDVAYISMEMLLQDERTPLRWRAQEEGPAFLFQSVYEGSALRELLAHVHWGALDYLLIDAPPGTDKLQRILELLPRPPLVLLVTTPSLVTQAVVARSIELLRAAGARAALVVNMTQLFSDNYVAPAELPVWAEVPFDRTLAQQTDSGRPLTASQEASEAAQALHALAQRIRQEAP